jgi:hypothetical protein
MSLESQIADLVSAANKLTATFSGKKTEIDQAVARAIAASPELSRIWYVDQIIGDDKAGKGTRAEPFSSIRKCIDSTPKCGRCEVRLLSDYEMRENVTLGGDLYILGQDASRKLSTSFFKWGETESSMYGFYVRSINMLSFDTLELSFPESNLLSPPLTVAAGLLGFVRASGWNYLGISVRIRNSSIIAPSTFGGALLSAYVGAFTLMCDTTVFPDDFGGKYIFGVAAGTLPVNLSNVLTNLKKL